MAGATRVLFITPQFLIDNTVINGNTEQKILQKCIRTAEDKYIMPVIGSPLYNALISKITGNTLTGAYKTLMDDYITPALLEYALYEYVPFTSFKFRNKGVSKQTSPDSIPADLPDLSYLRETVLDSAQFYTERLIKHLKANNSQTFPEYYQLRTIEDVPPARSDYFSGIQFPGMNRGCGYEGMGYTFPIDF